MQYFATIRTPLLFILFSGCACLMLVPDANAATLMEDTFDYPVGALDGTQNGGFGWNGGWTQHLNGGIDGFNDVMDGSLSFSNYPTLGNRVRMANMSSLNIGSPDRQYTRTSRSAGISKSSGDLWAAFLYQRITEEGGQSGESTDQWVEIRNNANFALGMSASPGNSFDYAGSGQGIAIRYDNQPGIPDDSASAQNGDVYLMIARWTKIDVVAQGAGTMWALSESDYDTIAADGSINAAELDANHYLKAEDTSLFTPQAINPNNEMRWVHGVRYEAVTADFDLDGDVDGSDFLIWQRGLGTTGAWLEDGDADENGIVNAIDLGIWEDEFGTGGYGASIIDYDELRYGDALEDVVLLPPATVLSATAVPEPSSMLLASLGSLLCVGRKRNQKLI